MNIDELLQTIRERRLILVSADEIWPAPGYTKEIKRAMRKHRRGLRLLIAISSIETCPSRDLHRKYWRYRQGRFECEVCRRVAV